MALTILGVSNKQVGLILGRSKWAESINGQVNNPPKSNWVEMAGSSWAKIWVVAQPAQLLPSFN